MAVICHKCGTWLADKPSDKAIAEFEANFPGQPFDSSGALCTPCYEQFWKWAKKAAPELERKHGR